MPQTVKKMEVVLVHVKSEIDPYFAENKTQGSL
jgi:hypothetical protein